MEGQQWKTWRNIFNPAFSLAHLMTLTPLIIDETAILCDILKERAEQAKIFPMKSLTDRWTMDIIGNVVLETNLNTQRAENPMVNALKRQIDWLASGSKLNLWERWHPFRSLVHHYCSHQINSYINADLDRHIANFNIDANTTSKSIVGLAMQTYLADDASRKSIDDTFRIFALSQVKQFLFSGHDTTSSTMCYIFYVLSLNPGIKERVEEEHKKSLGSTLQSKSSRLKEKPHLLKQLPYTTAVLKETMRLYPVASSLRGGEPGFCVRDPEGQLLPTDGFLVWAVSQPLHRDPRYWVRPETFIPERWLVGPEDPLYPIKGAWRPFEYGPRNCIGQELAMMELKVAMIFVLHTFDVEVAYAQFDLKNPKNPKNPKTVNGERAYQLTLAGPSDGLPCKVKLKQSTA
ncbi:MAG: hypothetical protein Q9200_006453 [Gallowayella weberi]